MTDVIVPGRRFEPVTLPYEATIPRMLESLVAAHGAHEYIDATTGYGTVLGLTFA